MLVCKEVFNGTAVGLTTTHCFNEQKIFLKPRILTLRLYVDNVVVFALVFCFKAFSLNTITVRSTVLHFACLPSYKRLPLSRNFK